MLTIKPDIKITRRLYSHFVIDEDNEVLLQTPHLAECFRYLRDHDQPEFWVSFDEATYRVNILPAAGNNNRPG